MQARADSRVSEYLLDVERRTLETIQKAADKIPAPKDGVDGFGLEDLTFSDDGDGRLTFRFERGDLVKEHTMRLPRFVDRGVFRETEAYQKGDGVTWGGSFFIAQKDDPQGKPGQSNDWRLAVKKGRDNS